MTDWPDLFINEEFRHWFYWTVIPLACIGAYTIVVSLGEWRKTKWAPKGDK